MTTIIAWIMANLWLIVIGVLFLVVSLVLIRVVGLLRTEIFKSRINAKFARYLGKLDIPAEYSEPDAPPDEPPMDPIPPTSEALKSVDTAPKVPSTSPAPKATPPSEPTEYQLESDLLDESRESIIREGIDGLEDKSGLELFDELLLEKDALDRLESLSSEGELRERDFFSGSANDKTIAESALVSREPIGYSTEKVEFAVFSPVGITPNSSFILDVWAYLHDQFNDTVQIAETMGRGKVLGRKPGVSVQRGTPLTITIKIDGQEVPEPVDSIIWDGSPTNASFIVNVSDGVAFGSFPGEVKILYEGILIAKVIFLIEVATLENEKFIQRPGRSIYPSTAFASYASENRVEVLSRIQGIKKVAPELDIFFDVFSLRSGEKWLEKLDKHVSNKDIFYLFWSKPASRSKWVEREWKIALQNRGIDYIDPVPLEEPNDAPPPQELESLHFHDAYVAYIKYEQLKRQVDGNL